MCVRERGLWYRYMGERDREREMNVRGNFYRMIIISKVNKHITREFQDFFCNCYVMFPIGREA